MTPEVTAAGLTWVLDTFFSPIANRAVGKAQEKIDDIHEEQRWRAAAQKYRESLINHYGSVRVLGQSEDIPLSDVFTDLYVLDERTALQRFNIDELMEQGEERPQLGHHWGRRQKGRGLVNQDRNLYILGKPGAGKTTFLKYITLETCHGRLGQQGHQRLPIFVSLHEWANGNDNDLNSFIVRQFDISKFPDATGFVEHLLEEGRALLLFDGLDEVRSEQNRRQQLTQLLRDFTRKYDRCQHLITCRIAASEYAFAGFRDVEVADFTPEQVEQYAQKWFGKGTPKAEAFIKALDDQQNANVNELCNTPLLLSLVCLYFDDTMSFPDRRAELYEDALDALLRKWDSRRAIQRDEIYKNLSHKRKQQMLAHIATPAFEKGQYFFRTRFLADQLAAYLSHLPNAPAPEDIDGEAVLRAIAAQHGLLVERAQGIYSFSHLTFQEFFTARYVADNEARGTTRSLIQKHLTDRRFREVFLLTASLIDEGDDFCHSIRHAIDDLIANEPILLSIATWADQRIQTAQLPNEQQVAVRLTYISLSCSLALSLSHALDLARILSRSRSLSFDIGLSRALDLSRPFSRALDIARVRSLELARTRARDLDLDFALSRTLALALALARTFGSALGFDYGLYYTWAIAAIFGQITDERRYLNQKSEFHAAFDQLLDLGKQSCTRPMIQAMTHLSVPTAQSNAQTWQHFADQLLELMQIHRDFRTDWRLNAEQNQRLNDYFYANELLVQCLKLAYVQDRQGIRQSLLKPPEVV